MRLIDANPIIERYSGGEAMKSTAECIHDEIFVSVLKNAPTVDAVEVSCRCKDCKHWKHFDHLGCTEFVKVCGLANYMIGANGYCLYGERRDGE